MSETTKALQRATYGAVFGRILTDKRRANEMEQDEVAKALRISQSTYSRIERGEVSVSLDMLSRIAAVFKVEPASLVGEADRAKSALKDIGVDVVHERSSKNGDLVLALLGGAALAALIAAALARK